MLCSNNFDQGNFSGIFFPVEELAILLSPSAQPQETPLFAQQFLCFQLRFPTGRSRSAILFRQGLIWHMFNPLGIYLRGNLLQYWAQIYFQFQVMQNILYCVSGSWCILCKSCVYIYIYIIYYIYICILGNSIAPSTVQEHLSANWPHSITGHMSSHQTPKVKSAKILKVLTCCDSYVLMQQHPGRVTAMCLKAPNLLYWSKLVRD